MRRSNLSRVRPFFTETGYIFRSKKGELFCNDAQTGETIWTLKLAPDQIHAAPTWADEKLYVPMFDGHVFVIRDT